MADEAHRMHPAWTLAVPLLAIAALAETPPERRLLSIAVSASLFALMQWLIPKCRFRTEHYFSAVNLALLLMLVKMVLAPILIMAAGVSNTLFVAVPSNASMNKAVFVDCVAYIALCFGIGFTPRRRRSARTSHFLSLISEAPSLGWIAVFAVLGLAGFVLAFGTPAGLMRYFLTAGALQGPDSGVSWASFPNTILRPFFAFAVAAWWARSLDREKDTQRSWQPAIIGLAAAIVITIANMTYGFNRAAFVFPVLTLIAVFSARSRRVSPRLTGAAIALLIPILLALGNYRASRAAPVTAPQEQGFFESSLRDVSENLQAYAGGPSMAAVFLDEEGWGDHLYGGSTLLASAMSPVPILGKPFRESSGPALYNRALYGMPGLEDQIIPFSAELFVNFHAAGVFAGFFLLGLILGGAELWFDAVDSAFGAFAIQYASVWVATLAVWSLSVVSQIAIYFFMPVWFYCAGMQIRAWLRGMQVHRAAYSIS